MIKIIRKHKKALMMVMAVVSIVIMVFTYSVLPSSKGSPNGAMDVTYGHVQDHAFTHGDVVAASQEWDLLKNYVRFVYQPYGMRNPELRPATFLLGEEAVYQIEHHPAMYCLLQREARDMGITISPDVLGAARNRLKEVSGLGADIKDRLPAAEENLLLVDAAFHAVTADAKVTDPMIRRAMALRLQGMSVNVVLFDARKYLDMVPKPQDDKAWGRQILAQFEKYRDVDPEGAPDGFGYRVPNQVKLQYLVINRKEVEDLIRSALTPVGAHKYYLTHLDRFPVTQPAATTRLYGPFLPKEPATRPFDEVRDDIYLTLTREIADDVIADVLKDIAAKARADFISYNHAVQSQGATTEPSSLVVPYDTFDYQNEKSDYFQALARHVSLVLPHLAQDRLAQVDRNADLESTIQPKVKYLPNLQGFDDLAAQPGIGSAYYTQASAAGRAASPRISLPEYALQYVDKYFTAEERRNRTSDVKLLSEWETSPPFRDAEGNVYIFRIPVAIAAHPAETQWDIQDQVTADVRLSEAYKLAQVDAQQFLPKAQRLGLRPAAQVAARPVTSTGLFENNAYFTDIPHLEMPALSSRLFIRKCFELLFAGGEEQLDKDHPIGLIDLPQVHKIAVVQINDVRRLWSMEDQAVYNFRMGQLEGMQMEQSLRQRWFDFDNLSARLAYKPIVPEDNSKSADDTPLPPPPPLNPLQDLSGT